jgi:hypothetical protein
VFVIGRNIAKREINDIGFGRLSRMGIATPVTLTADTGKRIFDR